MTGEGWRLRRAMADDADACALVAAATFLETYGGFMPVADMLVHLATRSGPAAFRDWAGDSGTIATLAEAAGGSAPIGYTVLTVPDLPVAAEGADIELRRIYTLAPWWGSGLGVALLDRALADAAGAGHRRMLIGVYGGNHRAHRFYEKHGFAAVGTRRFAVGTQSFDDLVYARAL